MKFTNVKQLIIKFMGGGLINFPTRFLRWVKINGDSDDSDDGGSGGSDSDVFFVPATIQPKYFSDDNSQVIEIKDFPSDITFAQFLYNKEDIISLGVEEGVLNSLPQVTIDEAYDDIDLQSLTKRALINKEVFRNVTVLQSMVKEGGPLNTQSNISIYSSNVNGQCYVYKISDDIFMILDGGDIPE